MTVLHFLKKKKKKKKKEETIAEKVSRAPKIVQEGENQEKKN